MFSTYTAYEDFRDLTKRTTSDKTLLDKAFDRYQRCLASMVYKFFDKKLLVAVLKMKLCLIKI